MWKPRTIFSLMLVVVFAAFIPNPSCAEEFSKEYKIQQLRNSAKMLKIAAVSEGILGGMLVYLGATVSSFDEFGAETGSSSAIYYGLGGVSFIGAYYTWRIAKANEREADRMERELMEQKPRGLLHLENGQLALSFPQVMLYLRQDRDDSGRKSREVRVALLTCSF